MAGETVVTIIGNVVADLEMRFVASGDAVTNFTVASTARTFDKATNEWKDADPLFMRCNIWRQYAENCVESLTKGMRVIVTGRLRQRSWETKEGEKRTVMELEVDEVGPSLRFATAVVSKVASSNGSGNGGSPVRSSGASGGSGATGYGDDFEPPF